MSHHTVIITQFCGPKICYWSAVSVNHEICIQWELSKGRLPVGIVCSGCSNVLGLQDKRAAMPGCKEPEWLISSKIIS